MTITHNQMEAEKELSIKEMQEKTIVAQNEKKRRFLETWGVVLTILVILTPLVAAILLAIIFGEEYILIISIITTVFLFIAAPATISFFDKTDNKLYKQNNELRALSPNAEYHKCHENKELICSEIVLNSLKLNFMDKTGKVYNKSIDIKDFETIMVDGITDTEVNLYEKKIYKPNPNFISFHTGTPQNCSRQIHKNKRKINLKMLRGN